MDGNRFHERYEEVGGGEQIKRNTRWLGEHAVVVVRVTRGGVHESLYLAPGSFQVGVMLACVQLLCNDPSQCHQGRYFDFSIQLTYKGVLIPLFSLHKLPFDR